MTAEEKKAWEERVEQARQRMGYVKGTSATALESAILALDAELTRLRAAVEWAIGGYDDSGVSRGLFCSDAAYDSFCDELRRRAKEG